MVTLKGVFNAIKERRLLLTFKRRLARILIGEDDSYVMCQHVQLPPENSGLITINEADYVRFVTLELLCKEIITRNITGNLAELGVYRGDFSKIMNHYFPTRKLYLFDTFEGFDARDKEIDINENLSRASTDFSSTSIDIVLGQMEYPSSCVIKKGYFPDTAKGVDDMFALVSLDADLYTPIKAGLNYFFPRLVPGGMIIVHDFNAGTYNGVRKAVREYAMEQGIGYVCLADACGSVVIVK